MKANLVKIVHSETSNVRVRNFALSLAYHSKIHDISGLSAFTEKQILERTPNFSKKSMFDLKVIMRKHNIEFKKED